MAITVWVVPTLSSLTESAKRLSGTVKTAVPVQALVRKPRPVVIVPKSGGGGASVPTSGQIWPRGTKSGS